MIDWRHWHNEPFLVGGLVILSWLYAIFTGPLRNWFGPSLAYPRREAWWFYSSLLLFYLAVGSPLDQVGERFLFSAHMVQHQLLMYPAALFFIHGLPSWLADAIAETSGLVRIGRFVTRPLIAAFIYALVFSVWHVPALYDWALQDKVVHIIEHLMFFASGILFWWPIASPTKIWPRPSRPGQMLFIFVATVAATPLYAFIVFSNSVLYPTYEFAPRITTLTPIEDQVLGGLIMKLGGMGVGLAIFAWSFAMWYREDLRERE